jgi:hypothetical protein
MDKLHQTAMLGKQLPVHLHSQRDLNDMLGYFEIGKSRLMSDGRVEYFLLENRDQKANPNAYF